MIPPKAKAQGDKARRDGEAAGFNQSSRLLFWSFAVCRLAFIYAEPDPGRSHAYANKLSGCARDVADLMHAERLFDEGLARMICFPGAQGITTVKPLYLP